jgi:hypothetical protein
MSSDFITGKNKKISKENSFLMLSDKLGSLFKEYNLDRNFFYDLYAEEKLFEPTLTGEFEPIRWNLFTRYKNSNNYSSNKFDDVYILQKAADNENLLDKTEETIESRKNIILNECSRLIENGICMYPNFQLTGLFPHLDKPNKIVTIDGIKDGEPIIDIPCFEYGFATFYATIDYTDSCGGIIKEPVPTYTNYTIDDDIVLNDKFEINTLTDMEIFQNSEIYPTFSWSIENNSTEVMIENNEFNSNVISIAALSTAIFPTIDLKLTYTE